MEPMIYTSDGNVTIRSLDYHHEWVDTPEYTTFREWYTRKHDGVIVKDSTHVYSRQGLTFDAFTDLKG